jgi:hypothetical protein
MANQGLISLSVRNGNDVIAEHKSTVSTASILICRLKFKWSGLPAKASYFV